MSIGKICIAVAAVLFVLAAFGASQNVVSHFDMVAGGLAFFAIGHLVP